MQKGVRASRIAIVSRAAAAAGLLLAGKAGVSHASPLFNVQILGRDVTLGQTVFNSTVGIGSAGDVIEYELVGNMSPVGTVYAGTPGATSVTITSLTSGPDGVNSMRLDLFE